MGRSMSGSGHGPTLIRRYGIRAPPFASLGLKKVQSSRAKRQNRETRPSTRSLKRNKFKPIACWQINFFELFNENLGSKPSSNKANGSAGHKKECGTSIGSAANITRVKLLTYFIDDLQPFNYTRVRSNAAAFGK